MPDSLLCVVCEKKIDPNFIFKCSACKAEMCHNCWRGSTLCSSCKRAKRIEDLTEVLTNSYKFPSIKTKIDRDALVAGTFQDFNYDSEDKWRELMGFQNELFMACREAGEHWAVSY